MKIHGIGLACSRRSLGATRSSRWASIATMVAVGCVFGNVARTGGSWVWLAGSGHKGTFRAAQVIVTYATGT